MNKQVIITCLLLITVTSHAQKIRFTDTTNVWEQYFNAYNDGHGLISYQTYHFLGDTVIGSTAYRKFNFGYISAAAILVREDTFAGKVYIREPETDSDVVLMDYHLGVGDTLVTKYHSGHHQYFKFVVQSIDSTLINGIWYKVWHFPMSLGSIAYWEEFDIVEGIGCIQHPLVPMENAAVEPTTQRVFCFSNNSVTSPVVPAVKHFNNTTSCSSFPTLKVPADEGALLRLVPNPTIDRLTISYRESIREISVCNSVGRVMYMAESNTSEMEINTSGFAPGLYFVRINGVMATKFVKQ